MPHSNKLKLLSPVLLRVAGLSVDVLDGLRAPVLTYRLDQHAFRRQRLVGWKEPLLADVFAVIEHQCPAGKPQQHLQQLRRDLHNDRPVREKDLAQAQQWLPAPVLHRLKTYIAERQALERYVITTAKLYRQQAIQNRHCFQRAIGNASFQRGLALSSLSLLRQLTAYRKTDPVNFRKDDFQIENGLLRYLSRAATKTTPYSTLTHLSTLSVHAGAGHDWKAGSVRSHVRLSVRLLGVFDALLRANQRLNEQWPVTLNPSVLMAGESLSYVRQMDGQIACVRLTVNPALRWVVTARKSARTYKDWLERMQERFQASGIEARQYIDKLIELGLLHHALPVSATDPDWSVRLHDWLAQHRWMAPKFVDSQLSVLTALSATAKMVAVATPDQRLLLLPKAHALLAEHIQQLAKKPGAEFWPIRPEQLFFEDVTRPLQGHLPSTDMSFLVTSANRLIRHMVSTRRSPAQLLADLFRKSYGATESVPLITFFAHYLSQPESVQKNGLIQPEIRQQWEDWAAEGLHQQTVYLHSNRIPDVADTTVSQGIFWQSWTNSHGQLCAALNELAVGFGRIYGRFLPYFDPNLTHEIVKANRDVSPHDCILVEATDDHFHNANFHPTLLDGTILTPAGHAPPSSLGAIPLNELSVKVADDGQRLDLWHLPTRKRVQVVDLGFQASRSRLYTFLCQFTSVPELSLGVFYSVVNQWFEGRQPADEPRVWPRIVLDRRLIIQRQTWWLPVGTPDSLPTEGDAFAFFRATRNWQQRYQLPDEVFVSLPHAPNSDDRKPQYIRFDNVLLVDLLRRLVRKAVAAGTTLKVVEMRPASSELPCIDGQRYAIEAVPQWHTPKPTNQEDETPYAESTGQSLPKSNYSVRV